MAQQGTRRVLTTHDGLQHCVSVLEPHGHRVAIDCPYTGKGEEFSPTNLVEGALAGCMLLAMGTLAMRNEIDLKGTEVEVKIDYEEGPVMRYGAIEVIFRMAQNFDQKDRMRLERAADSCPIKHSFHDGVKITVNYQYPGD